MLSMHKWKCLSSGKRIVCLVVGTIVSLVSGTNALAATTTNTTSFEYDIVTGLLKAEIREPDNAQLHLRMAYTYDKFGNRLTSVISSNATGEAAIPTHTAKAVIYDVLGVSPAAFKNALGQTVSARFDPSNLPLYIQGLNGLASSWTYDPFGRKILEKRPDGTQTKWEYLTCGGTVVCPSQAKFVTKTAQYASDGITVNGPWSKVYLDALERKIRTETVGFDGVTVITQDIEYDELGRVARASRPYYPNATIHWSTTSYDELGRVVLVTAPDGAQTKIAYDGLTTVVTNALDQTKTTVKNGRGEIVQVNDAQGNSLSYTYDPNGNLIMTTDPMGNVIENTYDGIGRKTSMTDPDLGVLTYEHDALGRLRRQVDAKGNITTVTYDLLGRIVGRAEAGLIGSWTYDTCYKGVGRLCRSIADNGYTVDYTFDSLGRPFETVTKIDTTYTTKKLYDTNGRLAYYIYPASVVLKYVYSNLGYLKEVRDNTTNALYWQANTIDADGRVVQQTFGNNVVTQTAFDAETGRVKTIYAGSGNSVQDLRFDHDLLGNLLTRTDGNQSLSETFHYDELNRLTSNTVNSSQAGMVAQSYTYDNIGNVTTRSDMGTYAYGVIGNKPHAVATIARPSGGVRSYSYDPSGNLTSEEERDTAGNIVASKGRTHSYTSFNMPVTLSNANATLSFVYGPEHQRIKQVSPSGTTIYLHPDNAGGLSYEKEIKSDGTIEHKHFISAGGAVVAQLKQVASVKSVQYFHRDHLGSTTVVTDQAGAVVERMAYEPFGKRRTIAGGTDPNGDVVGASTDRGYTNHEHLDELGLIHMSGRVYDPSTSRFTSADPNIPNSLDIQSYNRYSYTRNNPLMFVDPTGYLDIAKWLSDAWGTVTSIFGGGAGGAGHSSAPSTGPIPSANNTAGSGADCVKLVDASCFGPKEAAPVETKFAASVREVDTGETMRQFKLTLVDDFVKNNKGTFGGWGWLADRAESYFDKPDPNSPNGSLGAALVGVASIVSPGGGVKTALTKGAPTLVHVNPKNLIPQQVKSEMNGSLIKRISKDMVQNGFDPSQPISAFVRADGRWVISDGHHRAAAAVKANLDTVPVSVYQP